jgi:polyisoprenyl-teichoic acid--peptidoglycan teichoic acid transferase
VKSVTEKKRQPSSSYQVFKQTKAPISTTPIQKTENIKSKNIKSKNVPSKSKKNQSSQKVLPGKWLWIWLGLTGAAVVSATAGALLAFSLTSTPLKQTVLTPEEEAVFTSDESISTQSLRLPDLTRPVNILVLGVKVLSSEVDDPTQNNLGYHALVNSFKGLADTMLLVRFDPVSDKLTVLSIPRDTRSYVEGVGLTKLNEANYYGGPALAAKSVSNLLGDITIDRYVRVNVQAVEKLIDALGGVEVYVPKDMKYTDHSQHLYIDLKEGQQVLNGDKGMQFLRFRYDKYGDVGRIQRQQMLMRAIVEQTMQPSTIIKIPEILSVIQSYLDTNLSVEEIVALAGFASKQKKEDVQMLMVPGDFSGDGRNAVSYWLPHRNRIAQMMAIHFNQVNKNIELGEPTSVNIAIQDSTGDPEAVQSLITYLQGQGYRRVFVYSEWTQPLEVTKIVAQKGDDISATKVQSALGFGEVVVESTGALASDITIQLGKDWSKNKPLP